MNYSEYNINTLSKPINCDFDDLFLDKHKARQ